MERIMTCVYAQPLEDRTMLCVWVPMLLASPGLNAVSGKAMPHRMLLMQAPRQCLACLPAVWDRG